MHRTLVKICGTTTPGDALLAEASEADYLGVVVDHAPSPRSVSSLEAAALFAAVKIPAVAVTVNLTASALLRLNDSLHPAAIQLHGDERATTVRKLALAGAEVWVVCSGERESARRRAFEAMAAGARAILIDARASCAGQTVYGGTGHMADWDFGREMTDAGLRVILAGGLNSENVAVAVADVRPWMVDVVSGVELEPGVKNPEKVRAFTDSAHSATW